MRLPLHNTHRRLASSHSRQYMHFFLPTLSTGTLQPYQLHWPAARYPLRDIPVAVGQHAPRHTLDLARLALAFFSLMSSTLLNSLHVRPVLDATPMHALIYSSSKR